ncbi:hypothetical protein COU59_03100 [Candidatus Pacearchaeota archaeon CG10_big_fil_rev_8_21_14_0_10_34_12]|nr:MAG: hypothetical protein COU59_03100 [Candidatus Pacearchaeota archaeon CG10_big_fil_rev_8_21_14_0_10_34_12]
MERCAVTENAREVRFFRQSDQVSPSEVFNLLYSPLDPLIDLNRKMGKRFSKIGYIGKRIMEERRESVYALCKRGVEEMVGEFSAEIISNNSKKEVYGIVPRTNYDYSAPKRPNIILANNGCSQVVFREARTYSEDNYIAGKMRNIFKRKYKGQFPGEDITEDDIKKRDIVFVPEPHLILALEDLALEGVASRITPKIKLIESQEDTLWYMRDFLPSLRDASFDAEKLGKHIGVFNGLGLMDVVDGQLVHYCLLRGGDIVNIDPDFVTFTKSKNLVQNIDWPDFKEMVPKLFATGDQFERVKRIRNDVLDEIKNKLKNSTFLSRVPQNLRDHPSVQNLALDNFAYQDSH